MKIIMVKMGKHRNPLQEKIIVEFMECHQDIARGYVKGDKIVVESNWAELTKQLNSCGPPTKDCNGWKKTWADWKVYIKKKMCHNKKENEKTGGGPFNKYILSDVEESVARVSGLHTSVEGIAGAKCFGEVDISESDKENEVNVTPSTSHKAKRKNSNATSNEMSSQNSILSAFELVSGTTTPDPKRLRPSTPRNVKPDLNTLLKEENKHLKNICQLMEDQRIDTKIEKIVHLMEEQREEMRIQNQKLDRLCNILESHYKTRQLYDLERQKKSEKKTN